MSDVFEAMHTSASAFLEIGAIDKTTVCRFDDVSLLVPHPFEPKQIKSFEK